jgi:hypothetical protein
MIWRRFTVGRFAGVSLVPLLVAVACESPTLPLPPPATPEMYAGVDADHIDLVSGCGGAEDDAYVETINLNPTVPSGQDVGGARALDCGSWSTSVYAHVGDVLSITQQFANQVSTQLLVQVELTPAPAGTH